ncbi:hypothetical protein HZS_4534 [Henneguya salminicola]|nr:hypothetical protein HZS_4534 [Henneguya salminicola]
MGKLFRWNRLKLYFSHLGKSISKGIYDPETNKIFKRKPLDFSSKEIIGPTSSNIITKFPGNFFY